MAEQIHHIERVKFAVTFYVPGADEIGLVNVVKIKRIGEIRVLNAFGCVSSFFNEPLVLYNTVDRSIRGKGHS